MQAIASLLCNILYCGISLNAQNVLRTTGWMPEHTFTSGIEGPTVDNEGNLYVVDYKREETTGTVRPGGSHGCFLVLPEESTGDSIRSGRDGNMYVADYTGHNILRVDMKSKKVSVFTHEPKMNQPNGIVLVPSGNMYAGDLDWSNRKGQLWLITPGAEISLLEANMGVTNGIAVSEDSEHLYVDEPVQLKVWVYDICPDGTLRNKRLFHTFERHGMDGMKRDEKGNLYICYYDKSTIALLNPQGDLVEEIQSAGEQPSNLTFGGPGHRQRYVTLQGRGCSETSKVPHPEEEW